MSNEAKQKQENEKNFRFAASLIKIIAIIIAIMVTVVSRYALIFFSMAMMPTIFAIFLDRNDHRCLSATICSFNLIGALPYLMRMWESGNIDNYAKLILSDPEAWMIIYGAAFVGYLIYLSMPLVIIKIYTAKSQVRISRLEKKKTSLAEEWNISPDHKESNIKQYKN